MGTPARPSQEHLIIVGSVAGGLVAAVALVAAPFIPAKENVFSGVVLLGFALGWALLTMLSVWFSDQPHYAAEAHGGCFTRSWPR